MPIPISRKEAKKGVRRFGSEGDVEAITGVSRRTLQKNRLLGRGLRFYRFGRRVLYDLDELDQFIRNTASTSTSESSSPVRQRSRPRQARQRAR